MANKHFTTNATIMEGRRQRARDIRASRIQRERERQELLALQRLQRKFNERSGRSVA